MASTITASGIGELLVDGRQGRILRQRSYRPRPPPATRKTAAVTAEPANAALAPTEVVGELVADGSRHLRLEELGIVPEVRGSVVSAVKMMTPRSWKKSRATVSPWYRP